MIAIKLGIWRVSFAAALALACIPACRTPGSAAKPDADPNESQPPAAESPEPDSANNAPDGPKLTAAGIEFTVPEGWQARPPSSEMRAAEYLLPGDAGDADLTVYYFGQGGAGTRSANVSRWIKEYKGNVASHSLTRPNNGLMLTIVHVSGDFAPTPIDGSEPPPAKPNFNTLAVIIESGPRGPLYVKAVGPSATIESHMPRIDAFVASARPAPPDEE